MQEGVRTGPPKYGIHRAKWSIIPCRQQCDCILAFASEIAGSRQALRPPVDAAPASAEPQSRNRLRQLSIWTSPTPRNALIAYSHRHQHLLRNHHARLPLPFSFNKICGSARLCLIPVRRYTVRIRNTLIRNASSSAVQEVLCFVRVDLIAFDGAALSRKVLLPILQECNFTASSTLPCI